MKKIGFLNFRRFLDFPPIEYDGITFLIGRNNAGKSTVVKALLLINEYLRSTSASEFSFVNTVLEDANIMTYGRAKNKKADEDLISFSYEIENYSVDIRISGNEDKTYGYVNSLIICDKAKGFLFELKPAISLVSISKIAKRKSEIANGLNENIEQINEEILQSRSSLESSNLNKTSKEYIEAIEEIDKMTKRKALLINQLSDTEEFLYSVSETLDGVYNITDSLNQLLERTILIHDQEYREIQGGKEPSKMFNNYRGIKEEEQKIKDCISSFYNFINSSSITYLGANLAKQSALFSIRDKNNMLAQAIHEFYQLRIIAGETEFEFVEKWMKVFEVGDSFQISIRAGEAYEVDIFSNDIVIHLADKGMGSIQAMLLLFRLAVIIRKRKHIKEGGKLTLGGKYSYTVVIIEEPELNMHPALQSRLTDLFLEVHESFNIDFIVETHSEYIVRRSQVVVSKKEFAIAPNDNPFNVHYFPKEMDQQTYKMNYKSDGVFDENFGSGFFDEASGNTLELLRLKREKKS